MPSITRANGTNGSPSCVEALSFRLMNTCVVRPLGSLNAKATVPRVFETTRGRRESSGAPGGRDRGSAAMPNCAQWPHARGRTARRRSSRGEPGCRNDRRHAATRRVVISSTMRPCSCRGERRHMSGARRFISGSSGFSSSALSAPCAAASEARPSSARSSGDLNIGANANTFITAIDLTASSTRHRFGQPWPLKWIAGTSSRRRRRRCSWPAHARISSRRRELPARPRSVAKIRTVRLSGRHASSEPMEGAVGRRPRFLFRHVRRRHPARLPCGRRPAGAGAPLGGWCGRNSNSVLRPVAQRHVAAVPRDRRRAHARQGRHALDRVGEDGEARTATPGCGTIRSTSWCAASSTCSSTPATRRRFRCSRRSRDSRARTFDRSNNLADPTHNQRYYGVPQEWYTLVREPLPRLPADRQSEVQDVRRGLALPRVLEQVRANVGAGRRARRPRLQPRQHLQQRGDGVRRHRRSVVSCDPARTPTTTCSRRSVYATGGYGPNERFMAPDGSLGRALDTRSDTCEIVVRIVGRLQAGALPDAVHRRGAVRRLDRTAALQRRRRGACRCTGRGRNFYYGDYRVGGGMKVYNWDTFTCCSGTYIQNMADYSQPGLLQGRRRPLRQPLPAVGGHVERGPAATWWSAGDRVSGSRDEHADAHARAAHPLSRCKLRVPSWTRGMTVAVNGAPAGVECRPGTWATIDRTWTSGRPRRGHDPADAADGAGGPAASRPRRGRARPGRAGPRGRVSRRALPAAANAMTTWRRGWSRERGRGRSPSSAEPAKRDARHDERLPRRAARQERRAAEVPALLRHRRGLSRTSCTSIARRCPTSSGSGRSALRNRVVHGTGLVDRSLELLSLGRRPPARLLGIDARPNPIHHFAQKDRILG